ncbi:hypothetical protein QTP81_11960 [Alteromonas sp. ASW11-36]|uniref:Uncharacterized protein n=1 Tax=Alteromonas arenosi TaxID=3055817 RepID=A0ABT7SYP2_9ALTE|nr:hypothetical protein [Alteromonas sp. ASW11-36]MDM7861311.1 hypothetical protein [Alteromonas sp. ASW11-36]
MRSFFIMLVLTSIVSLQGCTTGELRALNDALAAQNGTPVYYPNQYDTSYVGDIEWTTGVWNGEGYQSIANTSRDYCKVRVRYEDDSYDFFYLDPGESTGDMYMSIYNQAEYMDTLCNTTRRVFNESF